MPNITLYHGSDRIIQKPLFGYGRPYNDFGSGFYCTQAPELAKEWACADNHDGYANRYSIDISKMKVLNLNGSEYNILNWLAVLTKHRTYWQNSSVSEDSKNYLQDNFYVDIEPYDIVIGYRADDSYFTFAQDFVANVISLRQLSEAMRLGKLGEQIVLKSPEAFDAVIFEGYEIADAKEYYEKKTSRDRKARMQYRTSKAVDTNINDIYMLDVMREGMKNGDPRLR